MADGTKLRVYGYQSRAGTTNFQSVGREFVSGLDTLLLDDGRHLYPLEGNNFKIQETGEIVTRC